VVLSIQLTSFNGPTHSTSMDTNDGDADIQTKKILFVTNSESGQANTILAMAAEAAARPHVQVHVASFPVLKQRVEGLSPQLNFHPLDGKAMNETVGAEGFMFLRHPPTTKSFKPYHRNFPLILAGWDGECTFFLSSAVGDV